LARAGARCCRQRTGSCAPEKKKHPKKKPKPNSAAEYREYPEWFAFRFGGELSVDIDRCGPFPTQRPKLCQPCENYTLFRNTAERDAVCGTAEIVAICPVPGGVCASPVATNLLRGLLVWLIVTPVAFVIRACLRCYGRGCLGSSVSFLFLVAAFAAIIIVLFVIASVVDQFSAIARLFATSWLLSLLLEIPLLLVIYACGGGKGRLQDKLARLREEAGMGAPAERRAMPVLTQVMPYRG
jgi:hypothetical protein